MKKKWVVRVIVAIAIVAAVFVWEKCDISFRIGLLTQGSSPFHYTVHVREKAASGEIMVVSSHTNDSNEPTLIVAVRNGPGIWHGWSKGTGRGNCAAAWCRETAKDTNEPFGGTWVFAYYGEDAIKEIAFKAEQIPDGVEVTIWQEDTRYFVRTEGEGIEWVNEVPVYALLAQNGCIQ